MVEGALSASRSHRSPAILPDHTYTMPRGGGGASGVLGVSPKLGLRMAHSFRDLPGLPNSWLQCSGQ